MFKTIEELKSFIEWSKTNKLRSFKCQEVEFELSELSFLPDNNEFNEIKLDDSKVMSDIQQEITPEEYNDLLFHSSN